ncbi:chaperonin 10-like protein [Geopyxis carbonaria]|nr:chaperonin 10-like protein [Geopyxis carbonaria]
MSSPEPTTVTASVLHAAKDLRVVPVSLPPPPADELQIAIRSTTLCGSDLHYYNHYRNGDILVTSPLALGHESSGIVTAVGASAAAAGWVVGDRVALEVGLPCESCPRCLEGRYNICAGMRFRSSAKAVPHFWGTLQQRINHPAKWCHKLPAAMPFALASLLEPLSVALHTIRRSAIQPGQTVLVVGAGAVGLLVAAAAHLAGASRVLIADINAGRVAFAVEQGWATHAYTVPMTPRPEQPPSVADKLAASKASADAMCAAVNAPAGVDIVFECTGVEPCVQASIYAARAGGTVMLVGMGTPVQTLPISAAALREVDIRGGFRYANCYPQGVELIASGRLQGLEKLVTQRFFGMEAVGEAFEMAGRQTDEQGRLVIKVEVVFGEEEAKL